MNVTITMGHVNDVMRLSEKDKALASALEWVKHWQRDLEGNLAPTPDSLNNVEQILRRAIKAPA